MESIICLETDSQRPNYYDLFCRATNQWDRWAIIRQSYLDQWAKFQKPYPRLDPYWLPWTEIFTPIESMTWNEIRAHGLPFYPQVPALNYFLDFASPALKVGLEVDGKHWHQDKERDTARDAKLAAMGWHIYRVSGSEVHQMHPSPAGLDEWEKDRAAPDYYLGTVEGVIEAILHIYFNKWPSLERYTGLLYHTLELHRLTPFNIGR